MAELKNKDVLAGDNRGIIYISRDRGDTWKQLQKIPAGSNITSLAFSPVYSSDETFFIGTRNRGVLKTVNGGASLFEVNKGIIVVE